MKPAATPLARALLLGGAFAIGTFVAETAQAQTYQANKYTDPATNEVLEYNLVAPTTIVPGTKYPLLVYLHAASNVSPPNRTLSSDGKGWVPQMMSADKAKTPSYWMIPISQTNSSGWGDPISPVTGPQKFEGRLTAVVVRELLTKLPIDADRLYVTGASMGARGTFDLLRRNPDLFAAGAPMASPALPEDAAIYATQNIWSVNGENDPVVQPNRDTIAAIRKLGGNPIYTELKGHGHDSWRSIYPMPEFTAWIFAQRKGVPWDKVSMAPTPAQLSAAGVTTTAGQDVVVTPPGGSFGGGSGVAGAGGGSAGGGTSTGGAGTEQTAGSGGVPGAAGSTGLAGSGSSSTAGSSGLTQAGSSALPETAGSSGFDATPAANNEEDAASCSISRPGTGLGATGLLALVGALAALRSRRSKGRARAA
jgi:hypothetical protein